MDGIGSTELLHMFIGSTAADAKSGSTGRVVPGYRAIVVDDSGRELPRGEVGRLAVSGPTGCRYLDDVENQRKYVQNGWNFTGDAYSVDDDGYFWYPLRAHRRHDHFERIQHSRGLKWRKRCSDTRPLLSAPWSA